MQKTGKYISVDDNQNIIHQDCSGITTHIVKTQYRILSKNDFGIIDRVNLGIFNKKTDFRISGQNSIICLDRIGNKVQSVDIEVITENPGRYFLIHRYSFLDNAKNNKFWEFKFNEEDLTLKVLINYDLGKVISKLLIMVSKGELLINAIDKLNLSVDYKKVIQEIIVVREKNGSTFYTINKAFLLNSNYLFLYGLLEIFSDPSNCNLPENINVYSYSLILTLLDASYSIRKQEQFNFRFKFSEFLRRNLKDNGIKTLPNPWFRTIKYFFLPLNKPDFENLLVVKKLNYTGLGINNLKYRPEEINEEFTELMQQVNYGSIELLPCKDLVFEKMEFTELEAKKQANIMKDLIMSNDRAHNFFLNNLPLMHNSDGDIMGVFALFTKEACEEAERLFSAHNSTKFLDPSSLAVQNFGAKNDSQLALYDVTT